MKNYVFGEPEVTFDRSGVKGRKYETGELSKNVEFLTIETDKGHETTIVEKACDFVYYVLEGSGKFVIDGDEHACKEGDLVVVPAGNPFTYNGKLKMLLTVSPPFWPEQEEVVE